MNTKPPHSTSRRQLVALGLALFVASGAESAVVPAPSLTTSVSEQVLPPDRWQRVESSVDRALQYLASQQQPDGTFPTYASAQPAVTSLCVMAFLSRGHQPGVGPYGRLLDRAIDRVISGQTSDGLFTMLPLEDEHKHKHPSHTATYNHAIAGLMLTEAFGVTDATRAEKIRPAVAKALLFSRNVQTRKKRVATDQGGWRYYHPLYRNTLSDSDLSVTGWHLMFYRSAKNAEFDVPKEFIDDAMKYVERCYRPAEGTFVYGLNGSGDLRHTRGMIGAGILSLAMGGRHNSKSAQRAGQWLLLHPFNRFGETIGKDDRFFYSAYYCSQAMFQLGGEYWKGFYPPLANTLLASQQANGAWPPETAYNDHVFGNCYSTALSVLSLTPPYQLIPIYQR